MNASDILAKASSYVSGDRATTHGDKKRNHDNIAALWNAYLAARPPGAGRLTALDVLHMMCLLKIARTQLGALNMDDYVDMAGYAACAGEVAKGVQYPGSE